MTYIAIIPARSGSKRLKNKNLLRLKKKSLFDHTLTAAKKCKKIDKIIVTTNIKKLLKKNSKKIFYIKRPSYLCKDKSNTESAMKHALNKYSKFNKKKIDNIILLQPTSPLRSVKDINSAIKLFEKKKYDSLFSGFLKKYLIWSEKRKKIVPINFSLKIRKRGQNIKKLIIENGAIFIFKYNKFRKFNKRLFDKIGVYLMSQKNSLEIDEKFDYEVSKLYLKL